MAVLVTGGAGYIGSHIVLALRDRGDEVVVVDDLSAGTVDAVPVDVPMVVGDAGDIPLISQVLADYRVDAIIHFAGSVVVPESVQDPLKYYRNNTSNSRGLIEAALNVGVRQFIFSSSAAVYGAPDVVPVPEDAPLRPLSP